MTKIHISEILFAIQDNNFIWIIIPIFFIGVLTDKYQEEAGTSVGNAISNGALVIFTGFSWLQLIFSRQNLPIDFTISQSIFSILMILYGFTIISSGFKTGEFAKLYGRIRVITFMLMFFTIIIYVPILFNFVSIILFVFLFPFYYAFISELIKIMPTTSNHNKKNYKNYNQTNSKKKTLFLIGKEKIEEYLK